MISKDKTMLEVLVFRYMVRVEPTTWLIWHLFANPRI